jgi:hypothetical protein
MRADAPGGRNRSTGICFDINRILYVPIVLSAIRSDEE